MRVVMKFGGTSVGHVDAIRQVVDIVRNHAEQHQVIVVVSAMNTPELRTTDTLIAAARAAAAGESEAVAVFPRLLEIHLRLARALTTTEEYEILAPQLEAMVHRLQDLLRSITVLGELTPRALDLISGQGERCHARLIAAAMRSAGLAAEAVDATNCIVTDDAFGNASPLMDETRAQTHRHLLPLLERKVVPVVTGFIAATTSGIPTTLGRGGSDYTAAILGAVLDAEEVWFWKEVDGVMSADPRVVPEARTIPQLSYMEMTEMAYYGANILHLKTVYPLVQRGIPIRILNTFNPTHPGTRISREESKTIKAVTAIPDVSLITISGPGMPGKMGITARIFKAVAEAQVNTLMITQASSEQSICLVVLASEAERAADALRRELSTDISHHMVDYVDVRTPMAVIAVVGSGMRGTPGIAGKAFSALGDHGINIVAIAQGSTEYNISFVVAHEDGNNAMRVIHEAFALGRSYGS